MQSSPANLSRFSKYIKNNSLIRISYGNMCIYTCGYNGGVHRNIVGTCNVNSISVGTCLRRIYYQRFEVDVLAIIHNNMNLGTSFNINLVYMNIIALYKTHCLQPIPSLVRESIIKSPSAINSEEIYETSSNITN